jgi:hypothetical protein
MRLSVNVMTPKSARCATPRPMPAWRTPSVLQPKFKRVERIEGLDGYHLSRAEQADAGRGDFER